MQDEYHPKVLRERRITLGVTGSIAAYKSADLASKLTQAGCQVDVLLTAAAESFVSPLTFQSVTGRRAYTDRDLWGNEAHVLHVGLAEASETLLIAPATANTLAKLALGLADNLISITALAIRGPLLVAPAMDVGMYEHEATQKNIDLLKARGVEILGPGIGRMASGLMGRGRMLETQEIIGHLRQVLGRAGLLAGRNVVVTAGGTSEPIDPVRVLTNRSSGKQGYAIAQAAVDQGATVQLITASTCLQTPIGVERIQVGTASEMGEAVLGAIEDADLLVMAAAVADFKPAEMSVEKVKRAGGLPVLALAPTMDILQQVRETRERTDKPQVVVGFAAESQDLLVNAAAKLKQKALSFIVANDITAKDAGFGSDTNRVVILEPDQDPQEYPMMSKMEVAETIIAKAAEILQRVEA